MPLWHEDDEFWRTFWPTMFPAERWERAQEEVDCVLALAQPPDGAAVLDLCCGPARHALELARRGYCVTGVDRTVDYLAQARESAASEGLDIEFAQDDMRRFRRSDAFDLAINLYTSFGYFEHAEDDRRVAENLFASLRPGGKLVMELMGKEVLARVFQPRDWHEHEGTIRLEERTIAPGWAWIQSRWILLDGDERNEFQVAHRLYSAVELGTTLESCGFCDVQPYGGLEGSPYDQEAKRLVVVAAKPPRPGDEV